MNNIINLIELYDRTSSHKLDLIRYQRKRRLNIQEEVVLSERFFKEVHVVTVDLYVTVY